MNASTSKLGTFETRRVARKKNLMHPNAKRGCGDIFGSLALILKSFGHSADSDELVFEIGELKSMAIVNRWLEGNLIRNRILPQFHNVTVVNEAAAIVRAYELLGGEKFCKKLATDLQSVVIIMADPGLSFLRKKISGFHIIKYHMTEHATIYISRYKGLKVLFVRNDVTGYIEIHSIRAAA